mgnify:CR=1 FL=1
MKGFHVNIEQATIDNMSFRRVVYTHHYMQLVYMYLKPGESIGMETHGNDQFFRFEKGSGEVVIDDAKYHVEDGSGVVVPAGARHNVTNTSTKDGLHLYTIYATPHHHKDVHFETKDEAEKSTEEYDGKTTE